VIRTEHIGKSFGPLHALHEVNFAIPQGEWAALLGANGAGKTTLIRMLAALTRPSAGSIEVAGFDLERHAHKVRQRIGVVSHHPLLYGDLSAEENLRFYGRMFQVENLQNRIDELLSLMELKKRRHDLVRTFSRGMQQRLSLARAVLHQPGVLLLDEPFTGLDLHATDLLTRFIEKAIAGSVTVFMSVHDLDYALAHAQRLLVLCKGRLLMDTTPGGIGRDQLVELIRE